MAKPLGYLVAGVDPAACERVCCEMVGFNPANFPLLMTAEKMGVGVRERESIKIIGDAFAKPACPDFKPAIQTPLRFTFPRICKSIAKQCIILLKGLFGSQGSET